MIINSLSAVVPKVAQNGNARVRCSMIAIKNMLNEKKIVLSAKRTKTFGTFFCNSAVADNASKVWPPPKTTSKIPIPKNKLYNTTPPKTPHISFLLKTTRWFSPSETRNWMATEATGATKTVTATYSAMIKPFATTTRNRWFDKVDDLFIWSLLSPSFDYAGWLMNRGALRTNNYYTEDYWFIKLTLLIWFLLISIVQLNWRIHVDVLWMKV